MEEGFILDYRRDVSRVSEWVAGPPEKGLFGFVKHRGRRKFAVETFRCERCNYLESYAPAGQAG